LSSGIEETRLRESRKVDRGYRRNKVKKVKVRRGEVMEGTRLKESKEGEQR
jgi:hypothetical protein